jgi:hypothetical protein
MKMPGFWKSFAVVSLGLFVSPAWAGVSASPLITYYECKTDGYGPDFSKTMASGDASLVGPPSWNAEEFKSGNNSNAAIFPNTARTEVKDGVMYCVYNVKAARPDNSVTFHNLTAKSGTFVASSTGATLDGVSFQCKNEVPLSFAAPTGFAFISGGDAVLKLKASTVSSDGTVFSCKYVAGGQAKYSKSAPSGSLCKPESDASGTRFACVKSSLK